MASFKALKKPTYTYKGVFCCVGLQQQRWTYNFNLQLLWSCCSCCGSRGRKVRETASRYGGESLYQDRERREERAHEQPRQVRLVVIGQIFPKVSHWLESQDRRDFRRKILQRVNHTFLIYPLHADFFKVYVPEIAASSVEAYQFTTATKRMKNCM